MSNNLKELKLNTAATHYLATLSREESKLSQQELYRFVRWYSDSKLISHLTSGEVASYAQQVFPTSTDYRKRLEVVKAFLTYAKKEGWIKENLAVSLKAKKVRTKTQTSAKLAMPQIVTVTPEGYEGMQTGLKMLKKEQLEVIEEIRRAAADKDLKENAPYHAARERKSYIDGKILALEETLKIAIVADIEKKTVLKANVRDTVVLRDLTSGEEASYTLVSPREVDPSQGRISTSSPIGRAIVGRGEGDTVEIIIPAGKTRYEIKKISH